LNLEQMKKLYLVRHAKSSWKYPELSDFERPLNHRGKKDAPKMGKWLRARKIVPDLIISSPAVRASTTAKIFSEVLSYPSDRIRYHDQMYGTSVSTLLDIIKKTEESVKSLMIFGHNPEITSLANTLSDSYIDNIPTCGIYALNVIVKKWQDISHKCGNLDFFQFPKNL